MVQQTAPLRLPSRRVGLASRVEVEYYCRGCKGHYSTSMPLNAFTETRCRCGSGDLLVYGVAGDNSSPMRRR